ncbi:helix-turn-helix domain-containing protein [Pedobacter glucosidilyticus]|uniref:helix-turn-helix domain-containing protein n=1 Tax=Pedobacter glucosidilyticus TaxID=1122941 RepID=UPI00040A9DC2|nr:AraC family transcriptional regulator [Pedobacter glucosidilyticus]
MVIYIKNMVCSRCKMVVEQVLLDLNLQPEQVLLGEAYLKEIPTKEQMNALKVKLENLGFEIIDDKKSKLIDAIKTQIIVLIHHQKEDLNINLSYFLSGQLKHDYSYLSNLFSEKEGITIEKYFITQKIEKVKELLMYDELSLSEIAYQLNYSSVAHLSSQFKKITGLTPSFFKNLKGNKRTEIEKL